LVNAWRCLRKKRLREYQEECFEKRQEWKITIRGEEPRNDPSKEDLFRDLCELIPERKRLARLMTLNETFTSADKWRAILDICSLCTRDDTILYHPQASTIDGMCPRTKCQLKLAT
jgi:hypothetical protein